ncbi:biotin carboxylase [Aeromicrobium sp. PE09-221]|uniref:acetyl-CoA carboxylase biotin carboxylase subunit n=1 Tax=Aeromicrobium sp. PE09-221 TaxID=1898043 RepID=UPI000B3ED492|nr:biotin carboxylase N-terminal domain-containing protein [Aeromicrobium sp. PE09-221]OUZ11663.1 biotin carboxylase [Aeromicrobium sp. PE09-221]
MSVLFIANRGEIAARIQRTARSLGWKCAVARPEVDAGLPYVREADISVPLDSPRAFGDVETMVAAAVAAGAQLVHPGYGFLSENPDFARAVTQAGMTFVGPSAEVIESMGDKANARRIAQESGVPVTTGSSGPVETLEEAGEIAEVIGFPLMVKAVAGGGGIAMAVVTEAAGLAAAVEQVSGRGVSVFGDGRMIVERYVQRSRHIEAQIMGLPDGRVIAVGERDCSVQRRHQKVVEESPSPALTLEVREQIARRAVALGEAVGYRNAGTVEFIYDLDRQEFYFLEMNTRLQVEHPVTEAVHGVDLVAWQLAVARGDSEIPEGFSAAPSGHAIELRIYAEDPERFLPRPGAITRWQMPDGDGIRVDAGYREGTTVTPFFDPLMAKVIGWGSTREEALERTRTALARTAVEGPGVNLPYLARVLDSEAFATGSYATGLVVDES